MKLQQLYTSCLAQGAYYIESEGEAVVIDPLREVDAYLQRAEQDGARIKYVIETHFHADFVSGHLDLAAATGATVVFGPEAKPGFEAHIAEDGEVLRFGKLSLEVLHTPGHTPESTCYLLRDEEGQPHALFSGDTLFIGDVGRPDLAAGATATPQEMAATLYRSLRSKIMPLPDSVLVYPAHGAGSACGKNMSKETFDTLGHQKEVNYALQSQLTEEAFVQELTNGIAAPPAYFPHNVHFNKAGYEALDLVLDRGLQPLGPVQFKTLAADPSVVLLDTRSPSAYAHAHLPGSIFVGLDGQFAPWVGSIFPDIHQKFLLVVEEGREKEAVTRLARVGYHQALGYLQGGVAAWQQADFEVQSTASVAAQDVPGLLADGRDMGTVIFPDAALKVFLTASAAKRADRRYKQLISKGFQAKIVDLRADLEARDARDSSRSVAPLKPAQDAMLLDNSDLGIEQSVVLVLDWWQSKQDFPV